jgi:hypothetical protein
VSVDKAVSVTAGVFVGAGMSDGRGVSVGADVAIAMEGSVSLGWGAPQATNNSRLTVIKTNTRMHLFFFTSVLL